MRFLRRWIGFNPTRNFFNSSLVPANSLHLHIPHCLFSFLHTFTLSSSPHFGCSARLFISSELLNIFPAVVSTETLSGHRHSWSVVVSLNFSLFLDSYSFIIKQSPERIQLPRTQPSKMTSGADCQPAPAEPSDVKMTGTAEVNGNLTTGTAPLNENPVESSSSAASFL